MQARNSQRPTKLDSRIAQAANAANGNAKEDAPRPNKNVRMAIARWLGGAQKSSTTAKIANKAAAIGIRLDWR